MIIYRQPKSVSHLPVIDLARSYTRDQTACRQVAQEIGRACRDTGFFYISNHSVPQSLIDSVFLQADRFFDQSDNEKGYVAKQGVSNGYEPLETQRLDNESPGDLKESFNFTGGGVPGTQGFKKNFWPKNLPGFRDRLEEYNNSVRDLGLHLSRLIAVSLGMPANHFDETFDPQKSPMRILRYPPQSEKAKFNQLGAGAHTDWGWITLLSQDSLGGLEVETVSGDWVRVDPIPGTFVVNLGDLLQRWTNGTYHSSLHRVMNNQSGRNRHSVVLFYNQAHETHVECLPTCLEAGEPPKYPTCSAGEHILERYNASRQHL